MKLGYISKQTSLNSRNNILASHLGDNVSNIDY